MEQAIKILRKYQYEGVPQEKFIEELGVDSKDAIKLLSKLSKKGLVKKEVRIINNKKVTHLRLYDSGLNMPVNLELVSRVPCFRCRYILICKPGSNPNPAECTILDEWLMREMGS